MKKTLKKALAMIMSVSMLGSLAVPVFAEETTTELPYSPEDTIGIDNPPYDLEELRARIDGEGIPDDEFLIIANECLDYIVKYSYTYETFRNEHGASFELRYMDGIAFTDDEITDLVSYRAMVMRSREVEGAKSNLSDEKISELFGQYKEEVNELYRKLEHGKNLTIQFIEDGGIENCIITENLMMPYELIEAEKGNWYVCRAYSNKAATNIGTDDEQFYVYIPRDTKDGIENNKPYMTRASADIGFEEYFETKTVDGISYITLDGIDYEYYVTADGKTVYFECAIPNMVLTPISINYNKFSGNEWLTSLVWYDFFQSDYNRFWYFMNNKPSADEAGISFEEHKLRDHIATSMDYSYLKYETGDIDGDGEVEITSEEQLYPKCDMDGDGVEEFIDVDTFLANLDRIENVNLDDRHINLVDDEQNNENPIQQMLEENETLLSGDVNLDGAIDVLDLGTLKIFVTKQANFTEIQNYMATGNTKTAPDIRNVTRMNQYLIKLVDKY